MTIREQIIDIVSRKPGIRATELISDLSYHYEDELSYEWPDINAILNKLAMDKEIVELEYILPTMAFRAKNLYFPKGTQVIVYEY
jgi:hypothetical protein